MNNKTLRKTIIPLIVLVVALAGSYFLYLTAQDADAQDTAVSINRGSIDVQEYFNERLRERVIDCVGQNKPGRYIRKTYG